MLLVGPLGALGALATAGCSDGSGPEEAFDGLGAVPVQVRAGSLLEMQPPDGARTVLAATDSIRLESNGTAESFTAGELRRMTGRDSSDGTPGDEPVPAPEGQRYLVVQLEREAGISAVPEPPTTERDEDAEQAEDPAGTILGIVLRDPDGAPAESEVALEEGTSQLLMLVPADPGPEDAVLEVVTGGARQRLSLVDGSLLHTDVPHAYDRWGRVAALGSESDRYASERRDAGRGEVDELRLGLGALLTTAYRWGSGWAPAGTHYLVVHGTVAQTVEKGEESVAHEAGELGTATLTLPDGTVLDAIETTPWERPEAEPGSEPEPGPGRRIWRAWFEIPTDLPAATVHLVARPSERRPGLAEEFGDSVGIEVDLQFEIGD
ncbi:hypothetical protein ACT3SP_00555 [Brachybacterium sp. AOP43-C2-M15]|uniref:hypothetical protein n=1 Tax=Brachybacterium sp. AOP43-C2-M15 TaxID=3457661 RepID=UPI004033747B